MKLSKAYTYLADVQEHKQVIPFRRFAGGIGRASQAKQFGTTKGQSTLSRLLPASAPAPASRRHSHWRFIAGAVGRAAEVVSAEMTAVCLAVS